MEDKNEEPPIKNNSTRKRFRIKYLLFSLFGIICAFGIVELLLRAIFFAGERQYFGLKPSRSTLQYYDNEIIGHAFVPHQSGWFVPQSQEYYTWVDVNSHGWPDREHTYEKPDNVYRILILGDSFVENLQLPFNKRFFRQLENKLNENSFAKRLGKETVEVIALGRGNTGTAQQLLILKEYGTQYHSDIVIHLFLTANDIKNNSFELENDPYLPFFELENDLLVELPHIKRSDRPYAHIKDGIKNLRIIELLLHVRQTYQERTVAQSSDYPIEYHVYDTTYNEQYEHAWELTQKLIVASRKIAQENNSDYMFVTLANNEQVNSRVWSELLETYPQMKNADLNLEKPDVLLSNFCEQENMSCYSMYPYFKKYIEDHPDVVTHNHFEGHWNELGTNLATEYLYEIITSDTSSEDLN